MNKFKLLCIDVRDKGFFVHWKEILFEITVFKITGFICVPNCTGKRGEIGFVRDRGEFEITVFEIAGVDCSANIGGILSQFEPSKKAQPQQLLGAQPLDPCQDSALDQ